MANVRQLATALGLSPSGTRSRLRRGAVPGATKRGRVWHIPSSQVSFGYGGRARAYWERGEAIPKEAHYPNPDLTDAYRYQFAYTVELTYSDGETEQQSGYTMSIRVDKRKPTIRELNAKLKRYVRDRHINGVYDEEYEKIRKVVKAHLVSSQLIRAQRRT